MTESKKQKPVKVATDEATIEQKIAEIKANALEEFRKNATNAIKAGSNLSRGEREELISMQAMGVLSSALFAISGLKNKPVEDVKEADDLVKSMEEISEELLSPDPKDLVGLHELSLVDLNKAVTVMRHHSLQANRDFNRKYSWFYRLLGRHKRRIRSSDFRKKEDYCTKFVQDAEADLKFNPKDDESIVTTLKEFINKISEGERLDFNLIGTLEALREHSDMIEACVAIESLIASGKYESHPISEYIRKSFNNCVFNRYNTSRYEIDDPHLEWVIDVGYFQPKVPGNTYTNIKRVKAETVDNIVDVLVKLSNTPLHAVSSVSSLVSAVVLQNTPPLGITSTLENHLSSKSMHEAETEYLRLCLTIALRERMIILFEDRLKKAHGNPQPQ